MFLGMLKCGGLLQVLLDEAQIGSGHGLFDVDPDEHAVIDQTGGQQVVALNRRVEPGCRTQLCWRESDGVRDGVAHPADDASADVQNDHRRKHFTMHRLISFDGQALQIPLDAVACNLTQTVFRTFVGSRRPLTCNS